MKILKKIKLNFLKFTYHLFKTHYKTIAKWEKEKLSLQVLVLSKTP